MDDLQLNLIEQSWTEVSAELTIVLNLGLTLCDAACLSMPEKLNAVVITADDKLYEKAKGHFRVLHLRNYV